MPIYLKLTQIAWAEEKLSGLNVSTSYATKLIPSVRVNHHNFSLKRIKSGTSDVLSWHLSCLYLILLNKLQSVRTHLDQMLSFSGIKPEWRRSKKIRSFWVLYGPRLGMWVATPFSEMAAHIVMSPPRWLGTSTVARWPIILRPRLRPLARLKPASSTNTGMCWVSFPSSAIILYNGV